MGWARVRTTSHRLAVAGARPVPHCQDRLAVVYVAGDQVQHDLREVEGAAEDAGLHGSTSLVFSSRS